MTYSYIRRFWNFGFSNVLCSVQCAVCSVQCAVCSVQCAVCSVQCAVCSVQCAVCSVQCAVCSVQCAVCSVQCAVCSVQCAVCSVQCAVCSGCEDVVVIVQRTVYGKEAKIPEPPSYYSIDPIHIKSGLSTPGTFDPHSGTLPCASKPPHISKANPHTSYVIHHTCHVICIHNMLRHFRAVHI